MLYDISDVCTIFGLTPSGVRYYEELGLIHPARTQGGRRKYSEEEMRRLLHIKTLRSYNVSLEDIRAYFLNNTTENGKAISDVLQEKIRQLELQLETLRASIESLAQYARQLGSSPETAFLSAREHQPAEHLHHGCFARAVRADQSADHAALNLKAHAVNRKLRFILLGQRLHINHNI